jgi:hypothetical protein
VGFTANPDRRRFGARVRDTACRAAIVTGTPRLLAGCLWKERE